MLTKQAIRGQLGDAYSRFGLQDDGMTRSVCRRVVADNACMNRTLSSTRPKATAAAHKHRNNSSNLRNASSCLTAAAAAAATSRTSHLDTTPSPFDISNPDSATAALRDATASASTSGQGGSDPSSPYDRLLLQRQQQRQQRAPRGNSTSSSNGSSSTTTTTRRTSLSSSLASPTTLSHSPSQQQQPEDEEEQQPPQTRSRLARKQQAAAVPQEHVSEEAATPTATAHKKEELAPLHHLSSSSSSPPSATALRDADLQLTGDQPTSLPASRPPPPPPRDASPHPLPTGVSAARDRDMYEELRSCEDWRDVVDVLADEAGQLSVRTAVQALTRLNGLTRGSEAARRELRELPVFGVLLELLHSQVAVMNNVQLSNCLQAYSQLQVPLPEPTLEAYYAAVVAAAERFYPRDIATVFAAAAALKGAGSSSGDGSGSGGQQPPQALLDKLGFRATAFMTAGQFDSRSLSSLLHGAARLGYSNSLLAGAAARAAAAQPGGVRDMAPQGVSNTLWALARLGCYHPPAVEAAVEAFCAAPLAFKPQEAANLLWALTALRHHPGPAFALLVKSLLKQQREQEEQEEAEEKEQQQQQQPARGQPAPPTAMELCNMYWGLALLGRVEGAVFGQLEAAVAAEWGRGGLPESLGRMAFQGFLASRLAGATRPPAFPPAALEALKGSWTDTVTKLAAGRGGRVCLEEVADILDQLQVVYDKRRPTGDGLALIDIALKAGPEKFVALQVIDETFHCANGSQLLGQVVMQRQLLEKNGWEVRFLLGRDLARLAPDMRPLFVADLLRSMGVRVRKQQREGGQGREQEGQGQQRRGQQKPARQPKRG
ncbi:hypothetical protein Agub_g14489 [Astrephomene gubernaculifera]|uniref:RAP domain-containing protein n=1 Tax=Astrephomene gubernaculifera TaxID=47775 RepID=A0AAD3HT42_9CHLO|nr:hypothetical protein Agub_g14489 [Astrephomene gubernaculifera]